MKKNYHQQAKDNLSEKLDVDHILNNTSVFHFCVIGNKNLDNYTLAIIKERFQIYFDSWIKEDLDMLLNQK